MDEVFCIIVRRVAEPKIINNKCEGYFAVFMLPQSRCDGNWCIAMQLQIFDKLIMCNFAGLF
jgi:hypothetical protein